MYLEHFGLNEAPFRITPHTAFFFAGAQRGDVLAALGYAVQHEQGVVKVTGEVGTGKTMLLRILLEQLPENVVPIWLSNPSLEPGALLQHIGLQLGVEQPAGGDWLDGIQQRLISLWSSGRQALALIDEAHAMPAASLEQIRLLSNLETPQHKLLQIVLFGQPELDEVLASNPLRPLRERITHHFRLAPLTRREVAAYLAHRLAVAGYRGRDPFTRPAQWALARASGGLTRRINILADKAMLAAYAEGTRAVALRHLRRAARDAGLADPLLAGRWLALAGVGAVAAGLLAGHWPQQGVAPVAGSAPLDAVARPAPLIAIPVPEPESEPVSTPAASSPPPLQPLLGEFVAQRVAETQHYLDQADGSRWCIQLSAAAPAMAPAIERQVRRLEDAGLVPVRIYAAPGNPVGRLGVIWGDFDNAAEARRALAGLPAWIREGQPYARSLASLRPTPGIPR